MKKKKSLYEADVCLPFKKRKQIELRLVLPERGEGKNLQKPISSIKDYFPFRKCDDRDELCFDEVRLK